MERRNVPGPPLATNSILAILSLEDKTLYRAADVARLYYNPKTQKEAYGRLRRKLAKFIRYHASEVQEGERGAYRAWRGGTWKSYLDPADLKRVRRQVEDASFQKKEVTPPSQVEATAVQQTVSPIRRFSISKSRPLTMAALLFIVVAITAATRFGMSETYQILQERGLGAAIAYVSENEQTTDQSTYEKAWIHFRASEYDEAKAITENLISKDDLDTKLKADCEYLFGQIALRTDKLYQSLMHFSKAHALYRNLGLSANLYHNAVAQANLQRSFQDYGRAADYLEQASVYYSQLDPRHPKSDIDPLLSGHAWLALDKNDYAESLQFSLQRYEHYQRQSQENPDRLAGILSDLGLLYALNDNLDLAEEYTLRAEKMVVELGDLDQHVHNLVNLVLLDLRQGKEPNNHRIQYIRKRAEETRDAQLRKALDLALRVGHQEHFN